MHRRYEWSLLVGLVAVLGAGVVGGCASSQSAETDRDRRVEDAQNQSDAESGDEEASGSSTAGYAADSTDDGTAETSTSEQGEASDTGDTSKTEEGSSKTPRRHHYSFAHQALRSLFFNRPEAVMKQLTSNRAEPMLLDIWQRVGESLDADKRIEAEGFRVESSTRKAADYRDHIVIIELPPPEATTEAYMVGLVVRSAGETSGGQGEDDAASPSKQWYFTLERSVSFDSDSSTSTRTVFGGWDGNTHLNFGTGPPPKVSAFRKRIEQKIQPSDE